jgi:hypothetical protein
MIQTVVCVCGDGSIERSKYMSCFATRPSVNLYKESVRHPRNATPDLMFSRLVPRSLTVFGGDCWWYPWNIQIASSVACIPTLYRRHVVIVADQLLCNGVCDMRCIRLQRTVDARRISSDDIKLPLSGYVGYIAVCTRQFSTELSRGQHVYVSNRMSASGLIYSASLLHL